MHFILHKDYFSAMLLRISKSEYPKEEMYATMSIEKVKAYLKDMNCPKEVLEFATSSATVDLAAEAAGVIPPGFPKHFASCLRKDLSSFPLQGTQKSITANSKILSV